MKTKNCIICKKQFKKSGKLSYAQWEEKKTCSRGCRNTLLSQRLQGRKVWNKGKKTGLVPKTAFKKGERLDEKHPGWTGDKPNYSALHKWVYAKKGRPTTCEFCETTGLTKHKIHWANKSGEYKRDLEDWMRLCVPCHKQYDLNR